MWFGFPLKVQKTPCDFSDVCWKTKKPRKTQKFKSFGPLRKVLDFWDFGVLGFPPRNVWPLELFLACEFVSTGTSILKRI